MSFYRMPSPWNPGYAIPNYVMAEPPERGTFTTQWMPRGTIPAVVPDMLAVPPGQVLLGRADAGLGSLGGGSLSRHSLSDSSLACSSLMGNSLGSEDYQLVRRPAAMGATRQPPMGKSRVVRLPAPPRRARRR